MTPFHSRPIELHELARLVPADGLIVAATDGGLDPRYASVRRVASELARTTDTCLLLLERAEWSSSAEWEAGAMAASDDPPAAGRCAGNARHEQRRRERRRDELAEAERHGVPTIAWTSRAWGSHGLADVVARSNASLVLLPADPPRRSIVHRVIRRTLEYYARGIDAPVVAVDESGATSLVEPLGVRTGQARPIPIHAVGRPAAAGSAR